MSHQLKKHNWRALLYNVLKKESITGSMLFDISDQFLSACYSLNLGIKIARANYLIVAAVAVVIMRALRLHVSFSRVLALKKL